MHLNVRVGALRLWPAGQREGGDGAPPRGRRPTVVAVQASILWADVKEQGDAEMRGVQPPTEGSWRRSTGIRSRDVGSPVGNDKLLRRPPFLMASAALMTPGGRPLDGVGVVRHSAAGKAKPVSPLTPGVAAIGSSLNRSLGLDPVCTFRSSRLPHMGQPHSDPSERLAEGSGTHEVAALRLMFWP